MNHNQMASTRNYIRAVESGEIERLVTAGADRMTLQETFGVSDGTVHKYTPGHLKNQIRINNANRPSPGDLFKLFASPAKRLAMCERWS